MATITSNATGNWNVGATWVGGVAPIATDNVVIATGHVVTQIQNESIAGIVINAGGELNIATYNNANSSTTVINGTLRIGTSAGTGLTTAGFTANSGATVNMQNASYINNSGDYTVHNSTIWSSKPRGVLTQTASANFSTPAGNNALKKLIVNSGVIITCTADCRFANVTADTVLNGTIALGSNNLTLGIFSGGSSFGASADITGDGEISFIINVAGTLTNNKSGAFSFTGTVNNSIWGTRKVITGDWRNANYIVGGPVADSTPTPVNSDALLVKDFTIQSSSGKSITFDNSSDNIDITVYGDILFDPNGGTIGYTKGTGTITLTGSSGTQTIALDSQTVEDIVINASGATKQFTETVTTDSLTGTAGTIDHNGEDMTTTGNYSLGVLMLNNRTGLNGMTLAIGGNYSVTGNAGNQIRLDATAGWTLNVTGSGSASYVDVKNSDASGGSTIIADDNTSNDLGSNLNWDFLPGGMEIQSTTGLGLSPAMW